MSAPDHTPHHPIRFLGASTHVAGGSEYGIGGIAGAMGEIIVAHAVVFPEVPDNGFDGGSPSDRQDFRGSVRPSSCQIGYPVPITHLILSRTGRKNWLRASYQRDVCVPAFVRPVAG
jgi:hypothetical protein